MNVATAAGVVASLRAAAATTSARLVKLRLSRRLHLRQGSLAQAGSLAQLRPALCHVPSSHNDATLCGQRGLRPTLQWQRWSTGTPLSAESMWRPQPAHVGLLHLEQVDW